MKFWTTQSDDILRLLIKDGYYKPDFSKSKGLSNETMMKIYPYLLDKYNKDNSTDYDGLIFGVSKLNNRTIRDINDYRNYFYSNDEFASSVSGFGSNQTLLEIEIDDTVESLPLNFQDFIIITQRMLGIDGVRRFIKGPLQSSNFISFEEDLKISQNYGWCNESLKYNIEQSHVGEICIEQIVGVYNTTDFEEGISYELSPVAVELSKMLK